MALRVIPLPSPGAEDVVVAADGGVYTGTEDGAVYRLDPDGSTVTRVTDTGGRPLGIEILGDGRLLVCDARRGPRIPERLQPAPRRTVRVQAYDDAGRLVHDVVQDARSYHMVTGVREHDGRVWLGSLHEAAVAVLDLRVEHA